MISGIELGTSTPSIDTLVKIALALKIDMNVLCGIAMPNGRKVDVEGLTEKQISMIEMLVDDYKHTNIRLGK